MRACVWNSSGQPCGPGTMWDQLQNGRWNYMHNCVTHGEAEPTTQNNGNSKLYGQDKMHALLVVNRKEGKMEHRIKFSKFRMLSASKLTSSVVSYTETQGVNAASAPMFWPFNQDECLLHVVRKTHQHNPAAWV